ncbi:MAG: DUF4012 domain-containing protein [Candidatus Viridilinea halotolerans]|uniref:DUF4012 domain-containing protein n=1 Tax=Candidatus Viridilinea halotolerans TaxID=2491704 RepID=A0A426TTM9_9CHLR|nr:MAG: DUF4012 domain-containing protein [Candidatus Viridilinea halotolerans]
MHPPVSQAKPHATPSAPRARTARRRVWRGVALLALLVLVGLGWWGWGLLQSAQAFWAAIQTLEALARDPQALLAEGDAHLAGARADLAALRTGLGPLPQVAQGFAWLPGYGHDLAAAAPLLAAGDASLAAAEALLLALGPLTAQTPALAQREPAALLDLWPTLQTTRPAWLAAVAQAQAAESAWAAVPLTTLSPALQARAQRAHELTLLAAAGATLGLASLDVGQVIAPLQPYVAPLHNAAHDPDQLVALLRADPAGLLVALEQGAAQSATARASVAQAAAAWAQVPPARLRGQFAPLAHLPALYAASLTTLAATTTSAQTLVPLLLAHQAGQPLGELMTTGLATRQAQISTAQAQMEQAYQAWAALDPTSFPAPLATYLRQVPAGLHRGSEALDLLAALPALLGANGQRDYLLLAQSGDELRATGGFITSAGILSLHAGHVLSLDMEDSGRINPLPGRAVPYAPEPLGRHMHVYRWVFRDANWSPDFPTAARVASQLYALSGRPLVADVVALDFGAFKELLTAIGPVMVEGETEPVSAATVRAYIERQHERFGSNNEFSVGPLTRAMLERIETGELELAPLIVTLRRLADERHLLIAASAPAEAELFARLGWDGAVQPQGSDFLMVVDDNLGYTKSNYSLQQALHYAIDLRDPTAPVATLTLTYTHTAAAAGFCPGRGAYGGITYRELTLMCYRGYLRVLVPAAATLLHAEHGPTAAALTWTGMPADGQVVSAWGDANLREFSTYFALNQGEQRSIRLRYSLPASVVTSSEVGYRYHLHVQKQAGREAVPLRIDLQLPPGVRLINPPALLDLTLKRDVILEVEFR